MSLFFYLFTLAINSWHWKFITADASLHRLSTINMILSDEDKILIQSLYLKGYTVKRLTDEFPEKSWTKHDVNKLFKKLPDTGTVNRRPGNGRPRSARNEENAKLLLQKFPLTVLSIVRWSEREHLLSVKKAKLVAYCGNIWSRSLVRFMRAVQFVSVSSCAPRLLKHFRCKSLQII